MLSYIVCAISIIVSILLILVSRRISETCEYIKGYNKGVSDTLEQLYKNKGVQL